MSEPRKRRWFQIHLSTALIAMFAAATLLYLNVSESFSHEIYTWNYKEGWYTGVLVRGWPYQYEVDGGFPWDDWRGTGFEDLGRSILISLIANVVLSLVLIIGLMFFCEFLIRRHEARKPPPETRN
ncbi:MAG: hypothetical protein HY291_12585 [Planctomycetes bacterium]|nr:hypothetical protein [Planctomycetota bacterium]